MGDRQGQHEALHEDLPAEHEDPLIRILHKIIRVAVRVAAVLMVLVILWAVINVPYVLYLQLLESPALVMDDRDIFDIFGASMVVLIAIEIFINIRVYLGASEVSLQLVLATALVAVARKVIMVDLGEIEAIYMFGTAAVIVALGASYWVVSKEVP